MDPGLDAVRDDSNLHREGNAGKNRGGDLILSRRPKQAEDDGPCGERKRPEDGHLGPERDGGEPFSRPRMGAVIFRHEITVQAQVFDDAEREHREFHHANPEPCGSGRLAGRVDRPPRPNLYRYTASCTGTLHCFGCGCDR